MAKIQSVRARQILDSRGNPTIEADVTLDDGAFGRAAVPSGASTGSAEALELRDGEKAYGGKGVLRAVANVNEKIAPSVLERDAADQRGLDRAMIALDGTENKSNLGANAILSVSLATAKAEAASEKLPLYRYIAKMTGTTALSLPMPMMNVMNGGAHANWSTDIQEYMILPIGAATIADAVRMGAEVFHALAGILKGEGYATTVGDEGGYAPRVKGGNREPLELIEKAVSAAGYRFGEDFGLGLDLAASEYFDSGVYDLKTEHRKLSTDEMIDYVADLVSANPLITVEDALAENDWAGWAKLTARLGDKIQLVGDDIFVTNVRFLQRAIDEKSANAILIKPNQIGTLTETIDTVKLAQANDFRTVISHRSGETDDTTITHLAVGLGLEQIKTGSLSRTDRVAKYNELMRIAEADPSLKLAHPFKKA